jgi:hypothetical protein
LRNRRELADCLRRRLLSFIESPEACRSLSTLGLAVFREMALAANDDDLIRVHVTCEDCGEQLVSLDEVDVILEELRPSNANQFLDLVDHFRHH